MSAGAPMRCGSWRVWLPEGGGSGDAAAWLAMAERVAEAGASLHGSKHAETYRCETPGGEV